MKISFLVTYYNQREYVRQSLDSILAIDKPDEWEILVGDDGSSDGTIEVVRDYVNAYPNNIFLFVMPRDKNRKYDSVKRASANRINLLEYATGDYFCVLDGDDFYCDKSFVEDAIEVFDNIPDISVVGFGYKFYTDGDYSKDYVLPAGVRGHVDKKTYLKSFYLPAGACVHKLCYGKDRIDFIKKIGYFDDNDIVINSLNYGGMYSIPKTIYAYRQTGQSVYTSMSEIEKALLNLQGLYVDLQLISREFMDVLYERNMYSILILYIYRKKVNSIKNIDKYTEYFENYRNLEKYHLSSIFAYKRISMSNKFKLKFAIFTLVMKKPKYIIKQYLCYIRNRT